MDIPAECPIYGCYEIGTVLCRDCNVPVRYCTTSGLSHELHSAHEHQTMKDWYRQLAILDDCADNAKANKEADDKTEEAADEAKVDQEAANKANNEKQATNKPKADKKASDKAKKADDKANADKEAGDKSKDDKEAEDKAKADDEAAAEKVAADITKLQKRKCNEDEIEAEPKHGRIRRRVLDVSVVDNSEFLSLQSVFVNHNMDTYNLFVSSIDSSETSIKKAADDLTRFVSDKNIFAYKANLEAYVYKFTLMIKM